MRRIDPKTAELLRWLVLAFAVWFGGIMAVRAYIGADHPVRAAVEHR